MSALTTLKARWQAASPREQRLLWLAGLLVAAALLWWLALAPALAVWRQAPAQQARLDVQLQHMRSLQAQARALQALPRLSPQQASQALAQSLKTLGDGAVLAQQPDRLLVTLKGVPARALAQWLASSRQNARLVPAEAHLRRSAAGADQWDGTLVFILAPP